jgi:hypothetical protein
MPGTGPARRPARDGATITRMHAAASLTRSLSATVTDRDGRGDRAG